MNMTDALIEAYTNALRAMADNAPRGLVRRALVEAEDKYFARIKVLKTIARQLEAALG